MVFWNKRKEQEDKETFYAKIFDCNFVNIFHTFHLPSIQSNTNVICYIFIP